MALPTSHELDQHWAKLLPDERAAFIDTFGHHPTLLQVGTELYKYSGSYPYDNQRQLWTPWWNLRSTQKLKTSSGNEVCWPGLADHLIGTDKAGVSGTRVARVRSAVKKEWNTMRNLFICRLNTAAWAFFGRCKPQKVTDDPTDARSNVWLMGGNFQLYIPLLQRTDLSMSLAHCTDDDGTF